MSVILTIILSIAFAIFIDFALEFQLLVIYTVIYKKEIMFKYQLGPAIKIFFVANYVAAFDTLAIFGAKEFNILWIWFLAGVCAYIIVAAAIYIPKLRKYSVEK